MRTAVPLLLALVAPAATLAADPPLTAGRAPVAEPTIYYEEAGRGPAVILIHGGQMDRRLWDDQMAVLAKGYRAIRYDVRGYGKSPAAARRYADTEDLLELMRALDVPRAHLVGLSLGGRIAIDFALEHPERVASLFLAGPGMSGAATLEPELQRFIKILTTGRDRGAEAAVELWLKDPYMLPAMSQPALAPRVRQICMENAASWLNNPRLGREANPPAATRLKDVRAPVLALIGDQDVPGIHQTVDRIAAEMPGAKKVVLAGAGHIPNMEKPAEFNRELLAFLAGRERADAEAAGRVIDKAVAAAGWAKVPAGKVLHWKGRAAVFPGGRRLPLTGEWHLQPPGKARVATAVVGGGAEGARVLVLDGDRGWGKRGAAAAEELDKDFLAHEREQFYLYWMAQVAPLKGPKFRLAALGESFVGDRRAAGVAVYHPDYRDVRLFLDAETSRPIKLGSRRQGPGGQEVLQEMYLADFRESGGAWWPRRLVLLWDGQPHFELTVTEFALLDKAGEGVFAKP